MSRTALAVALFFLLPAFAEAEFREFELDTWAATGRLWIDTDSGEITDSDVYLLGAEGTVDVPNGIDEGRTHFSGPLPVYDGAARFGTGINTSYITFGPYRTSRVIPTFDEVTQEFYAYPVKTYSTSIFLSFDRDGLVGLNRDLAFIVWPLDEPRQSYIYQEDDSIHAPGYGEYRLVSGFIRVPEPSTYALGTFALIGLLAFRRRR